MNVHEASDEMARLSGLLDDALRYAADQVKQYASSEGSYRRSKAVAWTEVPDGIAAAKAAWVDAATSVEREARDLADGMRQIGLEAIRARRAQLSALQSLLAVHRAEAEFDRTRQR